MCNCIFDWCCVLKYARSSKVLLGTHDLNHPLQCASQRTNAFLELKILLAISSSKTLRIGRLLIGTPNVWRLFMFAVFRICVSLTSQCSDWIILWRSLTVVRSMHMRIITKFRIECLRRVQNRNHKLGIGATFAAATNQSVTPASQFRGTTRLALQKPNQRKTHHTTAWAIP